jgi:hypothetical protein
VGQPLACGRAHRHQRAHGDWACGLLHEPC